MKKRFFVINIILSLFFSSFYSNISFNNKGIHKYDSLPIANAYLGDGTTDLLFNKLVSNIDNTIYLKNNYASYYFNNLTENFGNNVFGSCGYVSLAMLLSFYDAYWDDSFISNKYDVNTTFSTSKQIGADFYLIPSNTESPGIAFEPESLFENTSKDEYLMLANKYSDTYFQFKLFEIAQKCFGSISLDTNNGQLGLDSLGICDLLSYYLYDYKNFSDTNVKVNYLNENNSPSLKNSVINYIKEGTPVILLVQKENSNEAHSVIAYDYNASSDQIYVHTGWRDEQLNTTLTHVSLSDMGYPHINAVISLDVSNHMSLGQKYISKSDSDRYNASSFIFPREIQLVSGNYADMNPTFSWMSLWNEKWVKDKNPYFNFAILDSNNVTLFKVTRIKDTKYTLTTEQWEKVRLDIEGEKYQVIIYLDSDTYGYWDDYWCKETFKKPDTYQNRPYVASNEYNFKDAYPTDSTTKEQFQKHTIRGFSFETRRYRVGYIHNEDLVMSCIRQNINEAYIEYRFETALTRIDVDLSYWRDPSYELISPNMGTAVIQQYKKNGWTTVFNMLDPQKNLPSNRNNKNTYQITFDQPAYRIRFYSNSLITSSSDSNRGRICIGTMSFYESDYNLPLSGSELDYEPNKWNDTIVSHSIFGNKYVKDITNCYSYAVNAQKNPNAKYNMKPMQPGQTIDRDLEDDDYLNTNDFISLIEKDASILGFGFISVQENEICPTGYYKVALVLDNQDTGEINKYDYHWYRQNSDGTWSHKPGQTPVTNLDSSGKLIMNPRYADRNIGYGINYNLFIGYYAVKPLNLMYD